MVYREKTVKQQANAPIFLYVSPCCMLYFPSVCRLLCRCAVSIQTAAHEMLSVRACFKHGLREQAVLKRAPEKENDYAICYNTARTPWDDSSGSAESGNRKRAGSDQSADRLSCRRSCADGGYAWCGQDNARHGVFQGTGAELPPGAVYAGCAALGSDRFFRL